jgi:hypothetical protein
MGRLRGCLLVVVVLVACATPAVAAASARVRTRIAFVNVPEDGYYCSCWSLGTTSVPSPVARARLSYYRASTRSWVGYGKRVVTIQRYSDWDDTLLAVGRRTTDKRGYFTFAMRFAETYTVRYGGSKSSLTSAKSADRVDWVAAETTVPVVTTSSVDATHTRVTIAADYLYNPYVDPDVSLGLTLMAVDWRQQWHELYTGIVENLDLPLTGTGHAECSVVVPTTALEGRELAVWRSVWYSRQYDYHADDYSGGGYPFYQSPGRCRDRAGWSPYRRPSGEAPELAVMFEKGPGRREAGL